MKTIILMGTILVSSIANAGLTTTKTMVTKDPSAKQIEVAIKILTEAVAAKKAGNEKAFKAKLEKAKKYQEKYQATKVFNAAFIAKVGKKKINYFEDIEFNDYSDLRYDVMITETCFNGDVAEANKLLSQMVKDDVLNYDEEWFDNNKVKNANTISIDFVDGPNEYSEARKISKCN